MDLKLVKLILAKQRHSLNSGGPGATISGCSEQSYLNWVDGNGEPNQHNNATRRLYARLWSQVTYKEDSGMIL